MDTAEFRDELFAIRGENQRTLTDLDYANILKESMRAYDRAVAGGGGDFGNNSSLRKELESFLLMRVAALLKPAEYKNFVRMLKEAGIYGDAVCGRIGRFVPARLLKLRIFLYMAKKGVILFFKNQYKIFEKRSVQRFFRFVRSVASKRSLEPFKYLRPGHLMLNSFSVVITERCTLRCKHCGAMINYYKDTRDIDEDIILKTLEKVQKYADKIECLGLTGGEPFCNPNLKNYIRAVSRDVCKAIVIVTNGTILPTDPELISVMKEKQVVISFSNYGELSCKLDEFIKLLEEKGIRYSVSSKNLQWYDQGDLQLRKRTEKELNRQFSRCSGTQCINAINGYVYLCTWSSFGMNLGAIHASEDERVDILHLSKKEFIKRMKKLLSRNKALTACRYCAYDDNCKAIPRAEQMEKV